MNRNSKRSLKSSKSGSRKRSRSRSRRSADDRGYDEETLESHGSGVHSREGQRDWNHNRWEQGAREEKISSGSIERDFTGYSVI